jgi:hypothetical protein
MLQIPCMNISRDGVTIYRIWIGIHIYWTLKCTIHYYGFYITGTHRLMFSVIVFTVLLGSCYKWYSVLSFCALIS